MGRALIQPQERPGRHIKGLVVPGVGVNGSKGGGYGAGAGTPVFLESLGQQGERCRADRTQATEQQPSGSGGGIQERWETFLRSRTHTWDLRTLTLALRKKEEFKMLTQHFLTRSRFLFYDT